jgi:hypothetical protein
MSQFLITLEESQQDFFLQLLQQLDFVQEVQEVKPLEESAPQKPEAENVDDEEEYEDIFDFLDIEADNLPDFQPPKGDPPNEELYQIIKDAEEDC